MEKKRILFIESNKDGTIGGSYYSLFYLLEGLDKEKYELVVMFCEPNVLIPQFRLIADKVLVYDYEPSCSVPITNWVDLLKFTPRFLKHILFKQMLLRKKLLEIRPDLVHLNNGYTCNHEWILACRLHHISIIAHDRGSRPPASLQTRIFVKFLDAIICVSDAYLNNVHNQKLRPRRALTIYNALDSDTFCASCPTSDRGGDRGRLGIGSNQILVGMVGNIDYWKGQMIFVKAIKILSERHANIKAIIVGKTARGAEEYEKEIKNYVEHNGISDRVSLLGFRKNIAQLLNAMDIFVHASVEPEPFARVILEAMAMSKPIVATKDGGTSEQIEDGNSGLLVPMNDPEAMALAIEKYVVNMKKAKGMGCEALRRLKEKFSIPTMVGAVEQVYEEILGGTGH